MGWREILSSPDPSRALYLALRANPTASRAADTFQGAFEGAMEGAGTLAHGATVPARALAAAASNSAGLGKPVDVSDYALYGRDMETGLQASQYGDLLAGTLEDAGEVTPGSFASKVIRLAGNTITDPAAAPSLLGGAEAVGSLAGAMTPVAPEMTPTMPRRPLASAPRPAQANQPPIPVTARPAAPGQPGGPVVPRPTNIPQGPGPGPTATQAIPRYLQGTGEGPVGLATQEVPKFNPTATQEVPFHPDATQRVPMTRGPGGRGQLRPKAARKPKTKKAKEE